MTTFKERVSQVTTEIYDGSGKWHQIIIDFIQDKIEELLKSEDPLTSEDVAAASYELHNIREITAPAFRKEIDFMIRLENALDEWSDDMRSVNKILGIPPQK